MNIRNKIVSIVCFITALTITINGIIDYNNEIESHKSILLQNLKADAKLISQYCVLPLEFNYHEKGKEVLEKLFTKPYVNEGRIYDYNHKLFASFQRTNNITENYIINNLELNQQLFTESYIHLKESIEYNGKYYGYIYLKAFSNLQEIKDKRLLNALVLIAGMILLAYILASFLQGIISKPILQLTAFTEEISSSQDYSARIKIVGFEEINRLLRRFNYMLETIQIKENERNKAVEELKERNRFVESLINTSPNALYIYELLDGKVIYKNEGFFKVFGYSNYLNNEVDVYFWKNLMHPQDLEFFNKEIFPKYSLLKDKEQIYHQYRIKLANGNFYWLSNREVIYSRNSDGSPKQIFAIVSDINDSKVAELELENHRFHLEELVESRTEEIDAINKELLSEIERRKRTEFLLHNSLEKEKELNQLKSRFVSTASHEFRTPLTSILSSTELLQRYNHKWSEVKKNEHLERIKSSIDYLTKLMDDVIAVNRVEAGKTIYSPTIINLKKIFDSLIEEINLSLTKDIIIIFNYNSPKENYLLDPTQIHIILQNLFSNAVKYSLQNGKIEINVYEKSNELFISVSDNGIGIPKEDIPKLFESFHRASNVGEIRGTGLGLHIVKHAVQLHAGKISVDSKEGIGTAFTVTIPITA